MDDLKFSELDTDDEISSVENESIETNSSILSCPSVEEPEESVSSDKIFEENTIDELEKEKLEEDKISEECLALAVRKEHRLLVAQTMFKKSIKVSIKSFLISLSLTFLNFFI